MISSGNIRTPSRVHTPPLSPRASHQKGNADRTNPVDNRLSQLIRAYEQSLSPDEAESFAKALQAVDGNLFETLGSLREPSLFFATHPGFVRHTALLRELRTLALIVSSDLARLQAPWKPPASHRALVPVPTSHPTHSRSASMRRAYQEVYGYLAGTTPSLESDVLEQLLPPADEQWEKPSLVNDEMPMMAEAIANQAIALLNELNAQPSEEDRQNLLASTARPEVWGAYDQDGHPDTRPGFMLLQRAHLRCAMWTAYLRMALKEGLPKEETDRISATRDYWLQARQCLGDHAQSKEKLLTFEGIQGYPDPTGKLGGRDERDQAEKEALLALIGPGPDRANLRDVVERFGASGARGHFRFTAGGDRGLWVKRQNGLPEVDPAKRQDLSLRLREIKALEGDVGMVIIAECDDPGHVQRTLALMAEEEVESWLEDPEHGVIVMPLIEEGNMAQGISDALVDMLGKRQDEGKGLPREIHLMVAGSDLVNRKGKVGQVLETLRVQLALQAIALKFPGIEVRLMEGVGGSAVRTGGARRIVELRDAVRFMGDTSSRHVAITVQGIAADTQFATPQSARASLRQMAERPQLAGSDLAALKAMHDFLEKLDPHVGVHQEGSMRDAPGFERLYQGGNQVIDGIMRNRRDGSRTARQGTPSKGVGPDGERTISYVKMMRATGNLQWHHDWRKVPMELMEIIRQAWSDSEHPLHPLIKVIIADMAVELTRVDLELAQEIQFPQGLSRDPKDARAEAFSAMCEAHKHLSEFLRTLGIYQRSPDPHLLLPTVGPVRDALLEELGLAGDVDDERLETAIRARRGEARLQASVHREQNLSQAAYMLQFAWQRRNSFDGPGASDFPPSVLEALGARLHDSTLEDAGPSMMLPDGRILVTQAGEKQLGKEGLMTHEQFHIDSGRAKAMFFGLFGRDFYSKLWESPEEKSRFRERSQAEEQVLKLRADLIRHVMASGLESASALTTREDHARASLSIAREQARLSEVKLQALSEAEAGRAANDDAHGLALECERARQLEKGALAKCAIELIEALSSPEALKTTLNDVAKKAGGALIPNEALHMLFELSGGRAGVPAHMETLIRSEDTRDFAHALDEDDFARLRDCLPGRCADALRAVENASREAAVHRQRLLAASPDDASVRPLHGRMERAGER